MCENFHNETMCLRQKKSVPILRQARKMGENASKDQALELLGEKKKSLCHCSAVSTKSSVRLS